MSEGTGRPVALVTGASRRQGIGAAICRALARDGHDVAFTHWRAYDRTEGAGEDPEGPEALAAELRGLGARVAPLEVDLSLPDAYLTTLDATEAALGLPRVLVNNAAHSTLDGYEQLDAAGLDAHYAVNLRTTALLSAELARRWRGGWGRIVNMSSGQGRGPMRFELAYAASKGAIEAFTVSLAAEVGPLGLTVNAINPGPVDTGWMTDEIKAELLPKFVLGRIGQPEDVARLVSFLASEASGWITGQVINSEGGFLRR